MRRVITILPILLLALSPSSAWCWGAEGHRTVGMIADLILEQQPTIRDRVRQILGENTLSDVSVWADCAKGFRYCQRQPTPEEVAFTGRNPTHHSFHYTDVPIQQSQYRVGTTGTGSDDVVQVVKHAFNVLRGTAPISGPANLNQREALWLLVHLVGDIHQPLHVGAIYFDKECDDFVDPNVAGAGQPDFGIGLSIASTTGGGDLKIGASKNLHSYWDDSTVKGAMRLLNIRTGPLRISREPLSPIRRADGKQLGIRTRGRHSGSRRSCRWPTERSQGLISRTEHTSRENGTSSALGLSLLSEAIRNGRISRH